MWQTIGNLIASKKFIASVAALITIVGTKVCGKFGLVLDPATADEIAKLVCVGASAYVLAQGIADHGKSAAQISVNAAYPKSEPEAPSDAK